MQPTAIFREQRSIALTGPQYPCHHFVELLWIEITVLSILRSNDAIRDGCSAHFPWKVLISFPGFINVERIVWQLIKLIIVTINNSASTTFPNRDKVDVWRLALDEIFLKRTRNSYCLLATFFSPPEEKHFLYSTVLANSSIVLSMDESLEASKCFPNKTLKWEMKIEVIWFTFCYLSISLLGTKQGNLRGSISMQSLCRNLKTISR